jgi:hypothetical protein
MLPQHLPRRFRRVCRVCRRPRRRRPRCRRPRRNGSHPTSGTQAEPHSQKADPVFITQKTYRAYMFEKLMY